MSKLLEQWNEHIVRGNQLSRELEDIESILEKSKDADICFTSGSNGSIFIRVLSPEKMQELKENAVIAIMRTRDEKIAELEKLMGLRKPSTINPEFEAAVQGMVESNKKPVPVMPKVDPIEEKLSNILDKQEQKISGKLELNIPDVKRMYHDENKSMKEIAEHFGVTKSIVNNFIAQHNLSRKKLKDDGYLDAQVEARTGRERA
ncbi:MAG: hypothetical protein K0R92_365 [Lachnospiraceae bacterium]|nr:hypothetical protein [Lachnospiraceae bacterium]